MRPQNIPCIVFRWTISRSAVCHICNVIFRCSITIGNYIGRSFIPYSRIINNPTLPCTIIFDTFCCFVCTLICLYLGYSLYTIIRPIGDILNRTARSKRTICKIKTVPPAWLILGYEIVKVCVS